MKTWEEYDDDQDGYGHYAKTSREAYKQALKAEVEREMAFLEPSSHNQMFRGTLESHKRFLQLIETVKPKDE